MQIPAADEDAGGVGTADLDETGGDIVGDDGGALLGCPVVVGVLI
jgi:hypothetical protein